jgi:hypothetical protein
VKSFSDGKSPIAGEIINYDFWFSLFSPPTGSPAHASHSI